MDYSKLSDAEINQSITCIINPDAGKMALIGDGSCFYDCGPDGSQFHEIPIPDYCNNPADAWPIIQNSGISLVYDGDDWLALHFSRTSLTYPNDHRKHPDKPFRAALILWLMMQESE